MRLIFLQRRIIKLCLFTCLLLCSFLSFSQNEVTEQAPEKTEVDENEIYKSVETRPEFPGGIQAFYDFIGRNYRIPRGRSVVGKVFVQFVIEKDGSLTDIKVMKEIGDGSGKEAIRVLKKSPKWTPGYQEGKPVRVLYSLPIKIDAK